MSSAFTRATSKCRPAVPSALRGPSRTPTASSPPADASWGYAPTTLDLLAAPAIPPTQRVLRRMPERRRRPVLTGLHEVERRLADSAARARSGHPGPAARLALPIRAPAVGYAYVTSQMGTTLTGDPREVALRDALYSSLQKS